MVEEQKEVIVGVKWGVKVSGGGRERRDEFLMRELSGGWVRRVTGGRRGDGRMDIRTDG